MVRCETCRDEFRVKNFLFQHETPRTFVQFQFGHQKIYLIWRLFWALYHVVMIIYTGIRSDIWAGDDESQYIKWFIFLTFWAYFILTVSTIVDAMMVIFVFAKRPDIRNGSVDFLPWYMRANWCIWNLGNVVSVTTSLAYWSLVYNGTQAMTITNIVTHIINSLYVFLNLSVTGIPKRILHFWTSILVGVIYAIFTVIYHAAGGTNHFERPYVYSALDWRKPGSAILYSAIVCFVVVPVVHAVMFGIHCLKMFIYNKCECCEKSNESNNSTTVEMKNQYPY